MALILIISQWYKIFRILLCATYFDLRDIDDRQVAPDRKQRLHYPSERRPIISSVSCSAAVKNPIPTHRLSCLAIISSLCFDRPPRSGVSLVSAARNRHDELARLATNPPTPFAPVGVRHEPNHGDPEGQL